MVALLHRSVFEALLKEFPLEMKSLRRRGADPLEATWR